MKAYVITIRGFDYSESMADRCILSGKRYGVNVEKWDAVPQDMGRSTMEGYGLQWTWPNLEPDSCPYTGLKRFPYATRNIGARIGCALSHYELWNQCLQVQEPIVILEHDAVFVGPMPEVADLPENFSAIMLNNPTGATPKGAWWAQRIAEKGGGIHRKTDVFTDGRPDGLAGNSAYIISQRGSIEGRHAFERYGVWPNDATLCRQLCALYEVFPFVTETRQTKSTSGGY